MKLHNISPVDLKYKYKDKIKTILPGSHRKLPDVAKKLIFWYDEFQKHTIDLENIRHSNLLSGIENIAIMDVLRIEMTNSLIGFYHDPKRFAWRYVSPSGISQAIVDPVFELSEISKVKKIIEIDKKKYNSNLDKMTNTEVSNVYWIILVVLFLVVILVLVVPLLILH